jgi:hypothetical protein
MTTIRIKAQCTWLLATNAVQGETIGNLNIPAVLEYRVKTIVGKLGTNGVTIIALNPCSKGSFKIGANDNVVPPMADLLSGLSVKGLLA